MRKAFFVLALAAGCASRPPDVAGYVARVEAARQSRDLLLMGQSDRVADDSKGKLPLFYFPPDPTYNIPSVLRPSPDSPSIPMVYSDGAIRDVRRVGRLEFTLNGQLLHLSAFVEAAASDLDTVFVPFGDLTNRHDTYHAGRLLDLHRTPTGFYELDFNVAYNPACYLSPLYSCPVAPKENQLPVEIPAGERVRVDSMSSSS